MWVGSNFVLDPKPCRELWISPRKHNSFVFHSFLSLIDILIHKLSTHKQW